MKKTILLLFTGLLSSVMSGQIEVPQPSPSATVEQEVGLSKVKYTYSRPGMKGREIFGNLVPYNQKWRTGANNNTVISFDTDVKIEGKDLAKGSYAIYTVPKEDQWEIIFYKDTNNWGVPQQWDDNKVALKASAKVHKMPMKMETFTIMLSDLQSSSANLNFIWSDTRATLAFEVPTDKAAMASIEKVMNGPSAGDYYSAASYFHDEKKDLKKAHQWISKAVEMGNPDAYWVLRRKSLIEADLGMKKEAIATAKKSLAAAEKAGNQDYVKMNKASLKEWGEM